MNNFILRNASIQLSQCARLGLTFDHVINDSELWGKMVLYQV